MNLNQIERLRDYVKYLQINPLEVETLFKELLIGVSNFFRDKEAFEALKEAIIPALFNNKLAEEPVRVWMTGCATGEEAYSIAMLLREHVDKLGLPAQGGHRARWCRGPSWPGAVSAGAQRCGQRQGGQTPPGAQLPGNDGKAVAGGLCAGLSVGE